jgi:hypothetical protein
VSVDEGSGTTCAVRSLAAKYIANLRSLLSSAGVAEKALQVHSLIQLYCLAQKVRKMVASAFAGRLRFAEMNTRHFLGRESFSVMR